MSKTLTINGTDRTAVLRHFVDAGSNPGWVINEQAYGGAVGDAEFLLDDTSGFTVPGMKSVTLDESAASPVRVFTGYVGPRAIQRGPYNTGTDRQWRVQCVDSNVLFDDQILINSDSANRPAETDYARVSWLISTGALGSVSAGSTVPSGSNVDMDAVDYRGQHPRDVMNDCAQASGKNYFIYRTTALFLFYALASGSTFSSSSKISADPADVDGTSVFAPIIDGDLLRRDSDNVYSGVRLRYKRGSVYVRNATTESTFRKRESSLTYMKVKTSTKATAQAQKWLDNSAAESDSLPDISIVVPIANVNDIRAGHRIQVKIPAAGIASFTYYRIQSRVIQPFDDLNYRMRLTFMDDVRVTSYTYTPPVDEERSNATDDDASVIIDENGITVTNGTITVTSDTGATVTFDGTEQTFQIVASGTIAVGPNKKKTVMTNNARINTGLTYDPLVIGSFNPKAYNDGDWRVMMPYVDVGHTGLVLNQYWIKAKVVQGSKTDIQALLFTTKPPSPRVIYRYYILSKRGS